MKYTNLSKLSKISRTHTQWIYEVGGGECFIGGEFCMKMDSEHMQCYIYLQ